MTTQYQILSVHTLTRTTFKINKLQDIGFVKTVLNSLPQQPRQCNECIILIDEIYIKPSLTHHDCQLFGKAINYRDTAASTVCTVMVKCVFGGPEFIFKALPLCNLISQFLIGNVTY